MPRFSVVMPVYNAEATVGRAIESVLAQTTADWELVVVNDGSTDGTGSVIETYVARDPRIRMVSQPNAGCGAARNTAVRASRGEYLVRLDADDQLLPRYLEAMGEFISASPGYDIYSCNGLHVLADGSRIPARPGEFYETERSFTLEDMFSANHIFTVAVFTRALFDRIEGISPDVYCEDLDFWLRAFALGGARHRYTPQVLALYEMSDTQMTANFDAVCASRIVIFTRLIESGALTDAQVELTQRAIERTRQDNWIFKRRTAVRDAVTRVLGPKMGELVSRMMHGLSAVFRPLVAKLASRRLNRGREQ